MAKDRTEATLYVYDALNRLVAFKRINRHEELIEGYAYTYDALNRRITSTHHTPQGKTTRRYLYDKENIVAILNEDQELLATITHHPGLTDTPLSITNEQTGQTYYYHRDHQGSITALSNEAGEVVESFTYDKAYGTILEHTQSEETFNPYGYTGREYAGHGARGVDGTLCDLYYYRARYYDPNSGTFLSEDPIGFLSGDFNWYRYVGNDPVNFVDPSGLYSVAEFGYDATKNIAGVCDSLTFGATGWIGKKINAYRYGDAVANQTNEAIENSWGERGTDVVMLASGVGGLAKGGLKGAKMLLKNRKAIAGAFKAAQKAMKPAEKQIAKKCEAVKAKSAETGLEVWKKTVEKLCKEVDKLTKSKAVNSNSLNYTQKSVNYTKESLESLKDGVAKNKIPAGDVVIMPSGMKASMDNRRLVVAKKLGKALKARIRNFDDALSWCARKRFGMKKGSTWGDAAKKRISNQKKSWKKNPIKAPDGLKDTPKIKINGKVVDDI